MKNPLHILHLEDSPEDAALVQSVLKQGGITCSITQVQTRAEFLAALARGEVDLILSDFALPGFDGLAALEATRAQWPNLPFIIVSGTAGEEEAIKSLKHCATDYIEKDHLYRLVPEVQRAMQEVEDRAERRKLEEQFIQSQKMEVIGQLAGGVAHDFNNILAVIIGYADLMLQQLGPDQPLHKYACEIQHAVERATKLTRQLLIFSRKQTVQPVVLDPNEVLKNLDKMLRKLIDESVEMHFVLDNPIGRIKADSGYVGQVLMNLVINARDAMPGGGKLTIETHNVSLAEAYAYAHPNLIPGDYVMLAVSDTGSGMTDEVKKHLFESFFTTKPKGKGTGLGLTTCQTIINQCGGHIGVYSEVGKGTTFKVYFPRVEQLPQVATASAATGPLPRGTETLLVVEDEPALRLLAQSVLAGQGYEVLLATNGQDGLRVAREHKGSPIRLAVTDVIMPQMDGKVMADWLKATYPELKILFTSGYTDDALAHHGVLDPGVAFLSKPYTPATLTRKVRELLDTPPS
jgi:two-component system cell cycle sensor histidine kinase/response regulator CckA